MSKLRPVDHMKPPVIHWGGRSRRPMNSAAIPIFLEASRTPEAQRRTQAAMARGFQTRDAEMALAQMADDLGGH